MSTTDAENKQLVREYLTAVNERDWDTVTEFLAEDVVRHGFGEPTRGPEAIIEENRAFVDAFPDVSDTIRDTVAADDRVAFRATTNGTHEGVFQGIEPTGAEFEISSLVIFQVEDGAITEIWAQVDLLGLMQQLGVVEPPGEER